MGLLGLPTFVEQHYEVHEWKHASAILRTDFPEEWDDIVRVLTGFTVMRSHIIVGGGERSEVTKLLDSAFRSAGWCERKWHTKIIVDQDSLESPTHKVDCVKKRVALEIEWSNKDPFFDRDLNNSRLATEPTK